MMNKVYIYIYLHIYPSMKGNRGGGREKKGRELIIL